jgi:DNA-binding transcriptional regulator YdaS (Cro superfamily)
MAPADVETPLQEAVRKAGGPTALAGLLDLRQSAVSNWLMRGQAPLERCAAIEQITGVKCERLRPDVEWQRDKKGRVTSYVVKVKQAA